MEKQIQDLQACLTAHITESGYYRADIARKLEEDRAQLKSIEAKMDELIEIYTAANFFRRFIIGTIGVIGTITGMIYAWLHILEKKQIDILIKKVYNKSI